MDEEIGLCVAWRRHLHAHPELLYDLPATTRFADAALAREPQPLPSTASHRKTRP